MKQKQTISASIIAKNEQEMLPAMLESINGIDQIIIVDTGSEDNTIQIGRDAGAKVYEDYKWNDHFSEARNVSKNRCSGDWLLIIDCDEELIGGIERLTKFVNETDLTNYDAVFFDVDTGHEINQQIRLVRNLDKIRWVGAAHNLLHVRENNTYRRIPAERIFNSAFKINAGYSPAHQVDSDRTLRILTKEIMKGPQGIDGGGQFGMQQFTRYLYYLSREYLNRKNLQSAIYYLEYYIDIAPPTNELADVYWILATCYLDLGRIEKGLDHTLNCLKILPSHKAAWAIWANISHSEYKKYVVPGFHKADNKGVLFQRKEYEKLLNLMEKK